MWWINLCSLYLQTVWYLQQFRTQMYSDMHLFHSNVTESRQNHLYQKLSPWVLCIILTYIVVLWHLSHLRSSMTSINFIILTSLSLWLSLACKIWVTASARFELLQHSLLYSELTSQQLSMILWSWSSFWHCKTCRISWSFSFVWETYLIWHWHWCWRTCQHKLRRFMCSRCA